MTEHKPREFWIREPTEPRKGSCIVATEVKPPWEAQAPQASSHWLKKPAFKVIEKSAFDSVVKERDELRVENERLQLAWQNCSMIIQRMSRYKSIDKVQELYQKSKHLIYSNIFRDVKALRGADEK